MKKDFLLKIKKILLEQRQEIADKQKPDEVDFDGDEADLVQSNLIEAINSQLTGLAKQKMIAINNALIKIENNMFGECENCGEDIAEKRLLFNPIFVNCVNCAEKIERHRKQGVQDIE